MSREVNNAACFRLSRAVCWSPPTARNTVVTLTTTDATTDEKSRAGGRAKETKEHLGKKLYCQYKQVDGDDTTSYSTSYGYMVSVLCNQIP
jgi:hypothetical protein